MIGGDGSARPQGLWFINTLHQGPRPIKVYITACFIKACIKAQICMVYALINIKDVGVAQSFFPPS